MAAAAAIPLLKSANRALLGSRPVRNHVTDRHSISAQSDRVASNPYGRRRAQSERPSDCDRRTLYQTSQACSRTDAVRHQMRTHAGKARRDAEVVGDRPRDVAARTPAATAHRPAGGDPRPPAAADRLARPGFSRHGMLRRRHDRHLHCSSSVHERSRSASAMTTPQFNKLVTDPRTMPAMAWPAPPAVGFLLRYSSRRMPRISAVGSKKQTRNGNDRENADVIGDQSHRVVVGDQRLDRDHSATAADRRQSSSSSTARRLRPRSRRRSSSNVVVGLLAVSARAIARGCSRLTPGACQISEQLLDRLHAVIDQRQRPVLRPRQLAGAGRGPAPGRASPPPRPASPAAIFGT